MTKKLNVLLLSGAVLLLSACDTTKDALGLKRNSPDEHTVLEREPLTLPPNFNELPEPNPGAQRPQEVSPQERAKAAVLGEDHKKSTGTKTAAESELLKKAKAGDNEKNIRKTVDKEARADEKEKSFVKKIIGVEDEKSGNVINPEEEYEKINGHKHPKAAIEETEADDTEE